MILNNTIRKDLERPILQGQVWIEEFKTYASFPINDYFRNNFLSMFNTAIEKDSIAINSTMFVNKKRETPTIIIKKEMIEDKEVFNFYVNDKVVSTRNTSDILGFIKLLPKKISDNGLGDY